MADGLGETLDRAVVEGDFSGVVRLARGHDVLYERAAGMADRAHGIANTPDTRFGLASGAKGLTALATMALVGDGALGIDTSVRTILGDELPLVDPAVTIGHLLTHTSGIGDYLPEGEDIDIDAHALAIPVHQIESPGGCIPVLQGHAMKRPPGERFEYCNGGFMLLALAIEAASGSSYYDVVADRVCAPAGLLRTEFLRMDDLPADVAVGYVRAPGGGWRSNVLHLPVRGSGDGGVFSTAAELATFWDALFEGRIVPAEVVDEMVRPHAADPDGSLRYGLGFWLRGDRDTVMLEGYDAGTSFRSAFDRSSRVQYTVISNTAAGAWPLVRILDDALPQLADG